ncbi:hypothetical protein FAIPA1_70181 [Frankia sp. AiPs1]
MERERRWPLFAERFAAGGPYALNESPYVVFVRWTATTYDYELPRKV